jgi:hypothetical protein
MSGQKNPAPAAVYYTTQLPSLAGGQLGGAVACGTYTP